MERKKIVPMKTMVPAKPFRPEPALAEAHYEAALEVLRAKCSLHRTEKPRRITERISSRYPRRAGDVLAKTIGARLVPLMD
ncbi:hypothetical protein N4P33_15810 [Streptomyces sp. 15-116A]|uniref:hypothetical protein n=1 Tax=Streptomyces sp. 15-116A TaxID=2259035 RepID=UPI0021B15DF0|nr:hypothetical protein [Streptomyces sp. 15-116A]MCT7353627.1 hypothetical protein [Streptomyces sp. 15-116A]